ncbi:hypothetical protein [Mesorhizobium sp. 128a]
MVSDIDEFFEEYGELADFAAQAHWQQVPQQLRRFLASLDVSPYPISQRIKWLQSLTNWEEIQKNYLKKQSGIGTGHVTWPEQQEMRLASQLLLFEQMALENLRPELFAREFYSSARNVNEGTQEMLNQAFRPFVYELRRYLKRNIDIAVPEIEEISFPKPIFVPASDRTITVDHNSPDYAEVSNTLKNLEAAIRESNNYDDMDDKDQRIAEIRAGRRLLEAVKVRADALHALLYQGLKYLAKKFADVTIGKIATAALLLLGRWTGLW